MNKIKDFYSTKRMQKIIISLLTVILVVGGVSFAMFSTPTTSSKVDVSLTLTSKDIKDDVNTIINADIEIIKDKTSLEKVSVPLNKAITLNTQLEIGKYTIHMISAPIESDGSAYKIPSKIDNMMISSKDVKSGKTVKVDVPLERIAVADMTKEQLDNTINRISKEAPNNKKLIETLKKRQETIVSDKVSGKDKEQESQAIGGTPKAETKPSTDNSGGSSSSGTSGGSTNEKHVHSFITPNVLHHAEVPAQGYNETIPAVTQDVFFYLFGDGCKIQKKNSYDENAAIMDAHDATDGFWNWTTIKETQIITPATTHWVETSPAIPAWDETDGYFCACGAYRTR